MHIQRVMLGKIDDRGRDNLAVSNHNIEVRLDFLYFFECDLVLSDFLRLTAGDVMAQGCPFYRAGDELFPPPCGFIGLGDDEFNAVACFSEFF